MRRILAIAVTAAGLFVSAIGTGAADPINKNTIEFTATCSNGTTAEFVVASASTVTGHLRDDSTSVFVVKANTVTDTTGNVLFSFANPAIDNQPASKPLTTCVAFFPANTLPGLPIDTFFTALGIFTPRSHNG